MYQPLKVFFTLGMVLLAICLAPIDRFVYFYAQGDCDGHVQSLVLGGALFLAGFIALLVGLLADLMAFNRRLLEMLLERARRAESEGAAGAAQAPLHASSRPDGAAREQPPA